MAVDRIKCWKRDFLDEPTPKLAFYLFELASILHHVFMFREAVYDLVCSEANIMIKFGLLYVYILYQ